jgi:hypothetical protein
MSNNRLYQNAFDVESLSCGNISKCIKYPGEDKLYSLFARKLFIDYDFSKIFSFWKIPNFSLSAGPSVKD